ncbi:MULTISPECIES: glucosaminidase domain-containing protein [unclassified Enterococcus]|uniref:glucosaminidase domain-containing protein n=1 Tax=unclassified Enterococcus TaxID=2608891 RepID=UPI0015556736|nr:MULTISPECIES: glucosaminidase domain-containing protein [unclassified Enterococcus]MBS7577258.1 S-layer homology domain-containing protein [Enterococcus sp. MMGLQ5-2]MBS7584649.1 S-layer homology domain-containing protein [Enterococcus sp. MMGLQ5-1]NPD12504.1 hypothetical protein [Enterococcus sp. MMGLQ5-1]NPD37092.1 hypothetical protein [Enterococcus sp. MMGLQ5-2]
MKLFQRLGIKNKYICLVASIIFVNFFYSTKVNANAVNDYIISNGYTPVAETNQLGGIYVYEKYKNEYDFSYADNIPKMVIIHEVGVEGSTVSGEISYMLRNQENAFVHSFVSDSQLITIADTSKKAWGSGAYGNKYGVQIESIRVNSKEAFAKQINNLAKYTADYLMKYNMGAPKLMSSPSTPQSNSLSTPLDGNLASHKMLSYKFNQTTNHVDPDAYWNDRASRFFGTTYTMADFRELVQRYYEPQPQINSVTIEGNPMITGVFKVRVKTNSTSTMKVKVRMWNGTDETNNDDVYWATKVGDGEYLATLDLRKHQYVPNTVTNYSVRVAATNQSGGAVYSYGKVATLAPYFCDLYNSGEEAVTSINWLYQNGITVGYSNGNDDIHVNFGPSDHVTRGQMVTFLYRLAGSPTVTDTNNYPDVSGQSDETRRAISWATKLGITTGYGNGFFGPNDFVTREQTAAFLYRGAGSQLNNSTNSFIDVNVNSSFYDAVSWLTANGIAKGYTNIIFGSSDFTTREQMAMFIKRFSDKGFTLVGTPTSAEGAEKVDLVDANQTQKDWYQSIESIAVSVANNNNLYPSVMLSQAIAESAWGQSELAKNANNYFGIKADDSWVAAGKPYYSKNTQEYVNGQYITVEAKFRKYATPQEGLQGYADKLNTTMNGSQLRYRNVYRDQALSYQQACQNLQSDGYATAPDYATNLINRIQKYKLNTLD